MKGAASLAAELRAHIDGEVRFDGGSRALYATDASNYRQVPVGLVVPRHADDVIRAVEICRDHGAPVLPRGAGTSLAGQCCNVAVVIDASKYMNAILDVDPRRRLARVQPGVVLDDLRDAAEAHGLTFGPDPATHNRCTIGGMIGNNACGVHSLMAGKTDENVEALDVLTYDGARMVVGKTTDAQVGAMIAAGGRQGEIVQGVRSLCDEYSVLIRERFPNIPRRVSGYNLPWLLPEHGFNLARALVGSEGTCATVLEATLRLVPSPPFRTLLVIGYSDVHAAGNDVPEVLAHRPLGLEGFDGRLVEDMRRKGLQPEDVALLPEGGGWLMVETGGETQRESTERARELVQALRKQRPASAMRLFEDRGEQRRVWGIRESGLGAGAIVPGRPPSWPGWEDSAVPPERIGEYLADLRALEARFGYSSPLYGHFGEGCVHTRIPFDLQTAEGIVAFRRFMEAAADLVVRYGGSLSGEHGDGQARAELFPRMFGEELVQAFRAFKAIWDPEGGMNPGKLVDPHPLDANLRLGVDYRPARPPTHFRFPEDGGSLAQATLRCVGVGKCRRHDGGTMCPSYMVTREEQHSTRGRARLLFEMLREGNGKGSHGGLPLPERWRDEGRYRDLPLRDGWKSEAVREALDLCLSCKACKSECPVNVDMATYKAEFLSHYYAGRLRPRSAYSMGLIHVWARLACQAPALANAATRALFVDKIVKQAAGVALKRRLPAFAGTTFREWFRKRSVRHQGRAQVILWADTFNNYFRPETAQAAARVLEAAGYQVLVPAQPLCCGRPLYDYGFLDTAKKCLQAIVAALKPAIEAGVPVVGLEPSCVAVFRDEMANLLPHDANARSLGSQTFLLSEFLERSGYKPPPLLGSAIVQGHCHHAALTGMGNETRLLNRMGLDARLLDSGCCGMAGAFGFEREHYGVSIACGERVLLPAVRAAAPDTAIIADGFSCREQIEQGTDRRALHLAEVLAAALEGEETLAGPYPERLVLRDEEPVRAGVRAALPAAGTAARMWGLLGLGGKAS